MNRFSRRHPTHPVLDIQYPHKKKNKGAKSKQQKVRVVPKGKTLVYPGKYNIN